MKPRIPSRGGRIVAVAAAGLLVGGLLSTGVAQAAAPAVPLPRRGEGKVGGADTSRSDPLAIARKQSDAMARRRVEEAAQGRRRVLRARQPRSARARRGRRVSSSSSSARAPTRCSSCSSSSATSSIPNPLPGPPAGRQHHRRHRPPPQRDPGPRPGGRQQHPVAGRLQRGALPGHVLHPDGEVLRDAVLQPLLGQG